jgi:tetratricopeptide (TPR) repeat protein
MAAQSARLANPQNAEVRRELAQLYLEGRRPAKALALAREAVDVATSSPLYESVPFLFWRVLGEALWRRGEVDEAVVVFERALKSKSETGYFDALLLLSRCHWKRGDAARALEWAKHASQENTSSLQCYFRWAQAAAALGNGAELRTAREAFFRTRAALPRFSRQGQLRWAVAFWFFPLSRRIV